MNRIARKWVLGASLLLCLMPVSFALDRGPDPERDHRKCKPHDNCSDSVPEGGSAAWYLLAAGLTCLGAMSIRSRSAKQNIS
jgi:hypothetical protein